ncbi:MAG: FliH/SctL family protein [Defluviitaleaceae bacterium]|nr:FliH/SctL family protein [Defluviitaleaceae bacterium]MCL2261776.1 FliH/SctL family protein [Defluviitaleaceae bacterium]
MMLSSSRVYKSTMVNLDIENKIIIDNGNPEPDMSTVQEEDPNKRESDARKSAASIIKKAERQAEDIISAAVLDAESKKAAMQKKAEIDAATMIGEAREQGYNEGIQSATAEGEQIKAEARQVLEDAKAECAVMQANLEPEVVNMIISITEKLLGKMTEVNPAVIVNLVKQGFAAATISGEVKVYVSADDYDEVVANKDELMTMTEGSVNLEIVKDLSLSAMDCIIETPFGDIDCSLNQQFESIRTNLAYILNN